MALILLMPLMLIIYILVRVKLGKPAIFKQERPGKDEKIFTLYKFRTMTDEKDENGKAIMRDGQDIVADMLNNYAALNRNQRRNLLKIIKAAR